MINALSISLHSVTLPDPRYLLPEWFGGLRMTEHQLGVQEALDESDAALFSKVGSKVVLHHFA